jgi:hypothetical protein
MTVWVQVFVIAWLLGWTATADALQSPTWWS